MAYVVFHLVLLMPEGRLQPFAVASPKDHVELLEEHARRTQGREPHQNETPKKIQEENKTTSLSLYNC